MDFEKYKITTSTGDDLSSLLRMFTVPWVVMLALGALGHRMDIPYLFRFNYWDVWLMYVATSLFRNGSQLTWIFKKRK